MKNNFNKLAVKWSILAIIFIIVAITFTTILTILGVFMIPIGKSSTTIGMDIITGILRFVNWNLYMIAFVFVILGAINLFRGRDSLKLGSNEETMLLIAIIMLFLVLFLFVAFVLTLIVNSKVKNSLEHTDPPNTQVKKN